MKYYHIAVFVCVFLIAFVVGSNTSCQDVDHAACISMSQQNPHMCQDAVLGRSVCPNLCKKCPLTCYSCHTASYDVSACNQITCNQHQRCMMQSSNETGPFTLGCGTDTMCTEINHGTFAQNGTITRCCDSDLCNIPTQPTTPPLTIPSYRGPFCYSCNEKSIADAVSCQNVTCNQGEKCSIKSYFGSNLYTMGCMTQYYCDYFDEHALQQGSFSTVCCGTDLCNIPQLTTTGVPPVVTISHVLQQPFPECPRDIIVYLDQSEPLVHNWTDVKTFLTDIISTMDIGPNGTQTRVAMRQFDGFMKGGWFLDSYNHNKTELLLHIQTLLPRSPRLAPRGNMDVAVVELHHNPHVFNEKYANQPAALDVPFFITGSNGRRNDVMLADLRQRYSNIITIGIGNITNKDSVSYVATDSNHAIFLTTTAELISPAMERRVLNLICGT